MPTANGYTLGDDLALVVTTASGNLQFSLTEFKAEPQFEDLKTRPIGQPPVHDYIPDGWSGSFKIDRNSPNIDAYFAALEQAYWNNTLQGTASILQTVKEQNSGTSQWRYTKVALRFRDAGTFSGPKRVEQTIDFMASRKQRVS